MFYVHCFDLKKNKNKNTLENLVGWMHKKKKKENKQQHNLIEHMSNEVRRLLGLCLIAFVFILYRIGYLARQSDVSMMVRFLDALFYFYFLFLRIQLSEIRYTTRAG